MNRFTPHSTSVAALLAGLLLGACNTAQEEGLGGSEEGFRSSEDALTAFVPQSVAGFLDSQSKSQSSVGDYKVQAQAMTLTFEGVPSEDLALNVALRGDYDGAAEYATVFMVANGQQKELGIADASGCGTTATNTPFLISKDDLAESTIQIKVVPTWYPEQPYLGVGLGCTTDVIATLSVGARAVSTHADLGFEGVFTDMKEKEYPQNETFANGENDAVPSVFEFVNLPVAAGDVYLTVSGKGDYGYSHGEKSAIKVNGSSLDHNGNSYGFFQGRECDVEFSHRRIKLPASQIQNGALTVEVIPTASVEDYCPDNVVRAEISYQTEPGVGEKIQPLHIDELSVTQTTAGQSMPFTFTGLPAANTHLLVTVFLRGNYQTNLPSKHQNAAVHINGTTHPLLARGAGCSTDEVATALVVNASAVQNGTLEIIVDADAAVDPSQCAQNSARVEVLYGLEIPFADTDASAVLSKLTNHFNALNFVLGKNTFDTSFNAAEVQFQETFEQLLADLGTGKYFTESNTPAESAVALLVSAFDAHPSTNTLNSDAMNCDNPWYLWLADLHAEATGFRTDLISVVKNHNSGEFNTATLGIPALDACLPAFNEADAVHHVRLLNESMDALAKGVFLHNSLQLTPINQLAVVLPPALPDVFKVIDDFTGSIDAASVPPGAEASQHTLIDIIQAYPDTPESAISLGCGGPWYAWLEDVDAQAIIHRNAVVDAVVDAVGPIVAPPINLLRECISFELPDDPEAPSNPGACTFPRQGNDQLCIDVSEQSRLAINIAEVGHDILIEVLKNSASAAVVEPLFSTLETDVLPGLDPKLETLAIDFGCSKLGLTVTEVVASAPLRASLPASTFAEGDAWKEWGDAMADSVNCILDAAFEISQEFPVQFPTNDDNPLSDCAKARIKVALIRDDIQLYVLSGVAPPNSFSTDLSRAEQLEDIMCSTIEQEFKDIAEEWR